MIYYLLAIVTALISLISKFVALANANQSSVEEGAARRKAQNFNLLITLKFHQLART